MQHVERGRLLIQQHVRIIKDIAQERARAALLVPNLLDRLLL
jgi:hypothetical protein